MRPALLAVLLVTTPALAQVFDCDDGFDYSLSHRSLSSWTDGDLHVTSMEVVSRYGVRRRSVVGPFQARDVAVLGESYELRDVEGESWVLTIHRASVSGLRVQLSRVSGQPPPPRVRFHATEVLANGTPTDAAFGDLDLFPDGTYTAGGAHGGYRTGKAGLLLDGGRAQWGRGRISADGAALTFNYRRGPIGWEVKFVRVVPEPEPRTASR